MGDTGGGENRRRDKGIRGDGSESNRSVTGGGELREGRKGMGEGDKRGQQEKRHWEGGGWISLQAGQGIKSRKESRG